MLLSVSAWSLEAWCLKLVRKALHIASTAAVSAVCSSAGVQAAEWGGGDCLILKTTPLRAASNETDLYFHPLPKSFPSSTERERAEEEQHPQEALEIWNITGQWEQQQIFG